MYPESSLIMTKLNIPTMGSKLVRRQRLIEKLNTFPEYRLILITAPAGYGKTALITSWLKEKSKRKFITAWLSLDEDDNDSRCFWSYFIFALYKKIEDISVKEDIKRLYESSVSVNKLYLSHFIDIIAKFNEEIIIVMDDFNVINDDAIIENMKFLIKGMPSNMHIFIVSREIPELGIIRLRASDNILEVNQHELCFTEEETNHFFENVSINLSSDRCNSIWREAEGWAAGIQMISLSIKNSDYENLVDYIYKDNNFIFEYMAEEVFSNLEEEIKKFLLYTSILNEFSYKLCNYLLGIENSMDIIIEIEKSNLFLINIDSQHICFRYHNLFRSFLRKQLSKLEAEVVYGLFKKAAWWYESNNQMYKAIENYIKGKDFTKAVSLIVQIRSEILCRGEAKLLYKWNQLLPSDVVRFNSRLIMNSAWAALADGKVSEVNEYIKMTPKCKEAHLEIGAEIAALSSTNITSGSDLDRILMQCECAVKLLKPEEFLYQLIIFNMAKIFLLKNEPVKAVECFEKCLSTGIKTGQAYINIIAEKALTTWRKLSGEYIQAEQRCIELISKLKINSYIMLPITGALFAELSDIYYQWNELEKAMDMAEKGLKLGIEGEDIWVAAENYLMLAKIYNSMGLEDEYTSTVNKLRGYIKEKQFLDIKLKLESYNSEVMLRKGDILPALRLLNDAAPSIGYNLMAVYPEFYIAKIKLYICENKLDEAGEVLEVLKENAEKYKYSGLLTKVKIINSMLYRKRGDTGKAVSELKMAVELAMKQKEERAFLDEGRWMEEMLGKLEKGASCDNELSIVQYVRILLADFNHSFKADNVKDEILSKREIEILKHIQQGATNSEISASFFISINTVKTHLLNIYTKLDVHSRTRAVARAKELKLI